MNNTHLINKIHKTFYKERVGPRHSWLLLSQYHFEHWQCNAAPLPLEGEPVSTAGTRRAAH